MKKILIATSALAFASSAFAIDVSGNVIAAYNNSDDGQSLYNKTEVYISDSQTLSNGLTFGATYTIGFEGDSDSSSSFATPGSDPSFAIVSGDDADLADASKGVVSSPGGVYRNDYSNIYAFVSSSYGKIEAGHHDSASKAIGASSTNAGETINSDFTADDTDKAVDDAVTYTSPSVYGAQFAYSMIPGDDVFKSMALKIFY